MTEVEPFMLGSRAGLEAFLEQLRADRGRIENETTPAVDVIIDLLEGTIERLRQAEETLT